jgi:hypothetical protein
MISDGKSKSRRSNPSRKAFPLQPTLSRRLDAYALAATAAGVGFLAFAVPMEATTVCSSASITLAHTASFPLNPAHQQVAPFQVAQTTFYFDFSSPGFWNRGFFEPNPQGVMLSPSNNLPAALSSGALIGPSANFAKGNSYGLLFTYGLGDPGDRYLRGGGTMYKHRGNFKFGQTNYVGFRLLLSGQYHYGWARLEVAFHRNETFREIQLSETRILGYGYESTPDTPIAAGDCSGAAASNAGVTPNITPADDVPETSSGALPPSARGASLGLLALGDRGLSSWRKNGNDASRVASNFMCTQGTNPKSN